MLRSLLLCFALLASLSAHAAQDPECFPYSRYENEFLKQFKVEALAPHVAYSHCDTQNAAYLTVKAYLYLKDLPALKGDHPLDRGMMGPRPVVYLNNKIQRIVFAPRSYESCVRGSGAFYNKLTPGTMYVCEYNEKNVSRTYYVASLLLHEAYHSEEKDPGHVECDRGPYAGMYGSCDQSYEGGGAYAFQMEFLLKIIRTPGVSEEDKSHARNVAVRNFIQNFKTLPLNIRAGAVLKRDDGTLFFSDGTREEVMATGLSSDTIVFTPPSPAIPTYLKHLQPSTGKIFGQYFSSEGIVGLRSLGRAHTDVQFNQSAMKRGELVDVYDGAAYRCWIYRSSMNCWASDTDRVEIAFDFEARGLTVSNQAGASAIGPMIRGSGGTYYAYARDFESLKIGKRIVIHLKPEASYEDLVQLENGIDFILLPNKTLLRTVKGRKDKSAFVGEKYDQILGPIYWSSELGKI